MRDKDSMDCTECGFELLSWNGGVIYVDLQLVEAKENHEAKK
jgi:hypothetical protein